MSGNTFIGITIWCVKSKQKIRTLEAHNASVESVVLSPDGKYIISGSYDETIKIWKMIWK